jgi:hypothetical protein
VISRGAMPGALTHMRARAGEYQATFAVPPARATQFASALLGAGVGAAGARLVVDTVVFPPKHLRTVLGDGDAEAWLDAETVIEAEPGESAALLTAALQDWTDFWYVPIPGGFLLYGDRDEYSTIFAQRRDLVVAAADALRAAGFHEVDDYVRDL